MTPTDAIASLDRQLKAHGQTIRLQRGNGAVREGRGFVRGYEADKVVGLITLADRKVIVSPTQFGADLPRPGDDFVAGGRLGKVQDDVDPIYLDETLVRIEMRVRLT